MGRYSDMKSFREAFVFCSCYTIGGVYSPVRIPPKNYKFYLHQPTRTSTLFYPSMSMFTRPASPPPPMPSPKLEPTPLPSPPLRPRNRPATRLRIQSHVTPVQPSLMGSPLLERTLNSSRSCTNLRAKDGPREFLRGEENRSKKQRSRGDVSPPSTPRSLPLPTPPRTPSIRGHRRSLSFAIPYRSPPPSPTISAPPPVPPIPVSKLSPTDKKPVLRPQPTRITPIYLPDLDITPIIEVTPSSPERQRAPECRGERGAVMTCLRFFSLRNSNHDQRSTAIHV